MKLLSDLTLRKRIIILTVLALLLGAGLFSFLGMRAVDQATETMLQDRLTTARLMADYIDDALGRALAELVRCAQAVQDGQASSFGAQIAALEDAFFFLSFYIHDIYLLDGRGRITWSKSGEAAILGTDISFYPTISQALSSGEPGISGLVSAPVSDTPVIFLASPTGEGGEPGRGVLVVAIDISRSSIGGFIRPIRLGETGYVEIVDQNGIVLARTEPGPKLGAFTKSDHSGRFAALIATGKPTRGLCHSCHIPGQRVERRDVLAFVPLSQAQWGVVIRQSEEEALAPIRELRQSLLLFGAGSMVIIFLFVLVTTRDVASRIWGLTAASRRIAEGDLSSPIAISGKDEVGVLAQTFDEMRLKLQTSYGALEQKTKELASLLSVSEILTSLPDLSNLDTALGSALDKTLEIMRRDVGGILLWDEEREVLRYRVYRGLSEEYVRRVSCRLGEGIAGRVAQSGEPIILADISTDPRAAHPDLISVEGLRAFASVPIRFKDKVLGVLNIASRETRQFSAEDVRLLEGIAVQIATAIENARLHQEVQNKEKVRGELLSEIFSIQEGERKRIARELHDETSQVLASLTASLQAASNTLPTNVDKAKALLEKAQRLSISILDEIHRLIYELRPTLLDDLGLVAATRWLVDNILGDAGVAVDFKTSGRERRLPPQLETTLFRVIQEAVYNISRHAQAKNAQITLHFKRGKVRVGIKDDGVGFDVKEAISSKERPRGLGLLGMKERIELIRGSLSISSRPGSGTEINIEIPTG
ncbi:MAG TPA: GAF domain-containing protein [Dehalococcoidia bacterium]|nr:GAF domain-containing protein [Dehalococcoidia bacterium]